MKDIRIKLKRQLLPHYPCTHDLNFVPLLYLKKIESQNPTIEIKIRRPTDMCPMQYMTVNPRLDFTEQVKQIITEYKMI